MASNLDCEWESDHRAVNAVNEKDSFMVIASITTTPTKLSFTFIAAGKTDVVKEFHFGDVGSHRIDHSESGWATTETFQRWLAWSRMKEHAAELGIHSSPIHLTGLMKYGR
jgi:hypothetical protein